MTFSQIRGALIAAFIVVSASVAVAQTNDDRVRQMAEKLDALMSELASRNAEQPAFLKELEEGLATIEQADERVAEMIEELKKASQSMEDNSEIDNLIDEYKSQTGKLIAEAEASNNAAIKSAIPELQATLASLETSDEKRSATVVDARNVIRALEQDKEAIAFFIRANQTSKAAELISANVEQFGQIVANGKEIAASLLATINP